MKKRILCIDDDPLIRDLFSDHLGKSGFAVTTAANGQEGLAAFRRELPDLVLCDLRTPGMDGLELVGEIHKLDAGIPIVVVSGTVVVRDAVAALGGGAWDFVTKPVRDMQVLTHTVTRAFERAKLVRENDRYKRHLEDEVGRRTQALRVEIAGRRKVEERLVASLDEKEALLKEVHHRVKNNLQVISSLLRLQQQYVSEPASLQAFTASQQRVQTIALVHDLLYRSTETTRISAGEYVQSLVELLAGRESEPREVSYHLDVGDLELKMSVAIPCGLILNELLTNVTRHAFPVGAKSPDCGRRFSVSLHSETDSQGEIVARLVVADNGVGVPAGFDVSQSKNLGLQLVATLVAQLGGTITAERAEPGTRTEVIFPLP